MNHNIFTRPLGILLRIFLFLLPWQTVWILEERFLNGIKWEYGTLVLYGTEILFLVCLGVFVLWYWKKIKEAPVPFRLTKDRLIAGLWLVLFLYILVSPAWAMDQKLASQHARFILQAILAFWMFLLGPLSRREIIHSLAMGMLLPSLIGIWQFLTQSTVALKWLGLPLHPAWQAGSAIIDSGPALSEVEGRWIRAYGSYSHPNAFGGALALTLILFTAEWRELSGKKLLRYSALGILFTAFFFTFSRSAWLAFGIWMTGMSIRAFWKKEKQWLVPTLFIVALTSSLTIIYRPLIQSRAIASSAHEQTSLSERGHGVQESFSIIQQHPWWGVGPGNYTMAAYKNHPANPGWTFQPVHNVFLLALTELGIIGSLLLLICLLLTIKTVVTAKNSVFVFLCFCVLVVLTTFDHYLYSSYVGLLTGAIFLSAVLNTKITQPKIS